MLEGFETLDQELETYDVTLDEILDYLDALRESGVTNMFGASQYIQEEFDLPGEISATALLYWMRTFGERHENANS